MERAAREKIHPKTRTRGSFFWQVDPARTGIRVATAAVIGTIKEANKQFSLKPDSKRT